MPCYQSLDSRNISPEMRLSKYRSSGRKALLAAMMMMTTTRCLPWAMAWMTSHEIELRFHSYPTRTTRSLNWRLLGKAKTGRGSSLWPVVIHHHRHHNHNHNHHWLEKGRAIYQKFKFDQVYFIKCEKKSTVIRWAGTDSSIYHKLDHVWSLRKVYGKRLVHAKIN